MSLIASRRASMVLFSGRADVYSHQVRLVIAEKAIAAEIVVSDPTDLPEDLLEVNPYGSLPTLVDRELALYNAQTIMEYLDERFPHPPLMPADPVARARNRLTRYRIERDLYATLELVLQGGKAAVKARKELTDDLVAIGPLFEHTSFCMSDELTLVDCALAPLLWRLPILKIELPVQARALTNYAARMFKRQAFRYSLTEAERDFRL